MDGKITSARAIAELNIEHYSKLLRTSLDEQTRATVITLLAEERAKLVRLQNVQRPASTGGAVDGCEAPKTGPSSSSADIAPRLGPQKD
jgi:hypothetical protein